MFFPTAFLVACGLWVSSSWAEILFDGRVPLSLESAALDTSTGPYLTAVKGKTENATHYSRFLGPSTPPTPLWNRRVIREKSISVTIDNTSIFVPGSSTPQYGFRRTELIAQNATGGDRGAFVDALESGNTTFHFSIKADTARPLNYTHEYQIVFIEPSDGSHVFGVQLGSPFTNPTGPLPVKNARHFKVLDHAWNTLFHTQFLPHVWHNFAVRVDWDNLTLQVFYSVESLPLVPVTKVVDNLSVKKGPEGKGDFHIGVLKLPLVNPQDSPADQGDVVHHGYHEGTTEGLLYSGVFVERV